MIPLNYHHLYYFYVIATQGNISKAAKVLRIAQPTLSTQLKQFESFLDLELFTREKNKLILTEEGSGVLEYAKSIFNLGEELTTFLGQKSYKGRQKIQIGISNYIPKSFVEKISKFILNQYPDIYLKVIEEDFPSLINKLKTFDLDMILNDLPFQAPEEENIQNSLIGKIPVVFCANLDLAKKYKLLPKDLNGAPVYLPTSQSQTYHALQQYFLENNIKPFIKGEIQDIELVRRLVLAGQGIAPLNEHTIQHAPSKKNLIILKSVKGMNIFDYIYLIRKKRKHPHPVVNWLLKKHPFAT